MQDLHPVLVHFPIALFPVALLFWILDWRRPARLVLYLACGFAVASVLTGLWAMEHLHETGGPEHDWVHVHRNFMLATLGLGAVAAVFATLDWRWVTIGALCATTAVLWLGADRGAYLVYGLGIGVQGQEEKHPPTHEEHPPHSRTHGMMEHDHAREGSGTAWLPESASMPAIHVPVGEWTLMVHGAAFVGWDYQSTDRGDDQFFSANWAMAKLSRDLWGGELAIRAMMSLDPWTVGEEGYPLLLQSGEELVDRQHPHDLFMEFAAMYDREWFQIYAAVVGEPALGPVAFMHRPSASSDPMAPLGHHWQDSTHISYGVLTAGVYTSWGKLEGSWFNGHEPDSRRYDFDFHTLDSWAVRLTVNPGDAWSFQVSGGKLDEPEIAEPGVGVKRATASVLYSRDGFDAAAIWGMNDPTEGPTTHSFLIEGNYAIDEHHTVFGRLEYVQKTGHDLELAGLEDERFGIGSLSLGYLYNFSKCGPVLPGVGLRLSANLVGDRLEDEYGSRLSYGVMIFFRFLLTD